MALSLFPEIQIFFRPKIIFWPAVEGVGSERGVAVCGSEVGGVVVTCAPGSQPTLAFRDSETGAKIMEVNILGRAEVLWADSTKLVTIARDLASSGAVSVIRML